MYNENFCKSATGFLDQAFIEYLLLEPCEVLQSLWHCLTVDMP